MFTGIIEGMGEVLGTESEGTNRNIQIGNPISDDLKIDQSVAHNGVCLTVARKGEGSYWVTAVAETLRRSTLGDLVPGDKVNLERCMLNNGRFDGHIVQGHVDQVGTIASIKDEGGSWLFRITYQPSEGNITVDKGSIAVNGVSLTCFDSSDNGFSVAIIPYTYHHTNFHLLKSGDRVNLEFDIIGKYVKRLLGSR